ncbi:MULTISPECIES: hypothetical protein [unclassified Psychrobacter]|nr:MULTISPECIES: hypothetical protein [unclassified Psychrobacter]
MTYIIRHYTSVTTYTAISITSALAINAPFISLTLDHDANI